MKVKASITLSRESLRAVDRLAKGGRSRSSVIEDAIRVYLLREERLRRDARDLERLNASSEYLNAEMEDILAYQGDL
jgi:metal-responsive CopG/Arc/MetJ family transcriptional regulator